MTVYSSITIPWQPVSTAPLDREVEVQVTDGFGCYTLPFSCRLTDTGWINTATNKQLTIQPTHWRGIRPGR